MPTRLEIDENVYNRIYDMMQLIVQKLPEDLKQSLLSNSIFTQYRTVNNNNNNNSLNISSSHSSSSHKSSPNMLQSI